MLRYTVADGAERYRRIMRVLYREDQHFGFPLGPAEVAERLRHELGLGLDDQSLDGALAQLHAWGAAHRDFDTSLVSSARELRRNRFVYEITQAAKRVERLLAELDGLEESVGALDGRRLPAIRDALGRLAESLAADEPDGARLRGDLERLLDEVGRLHAGASDFMGRLNRVIVGSEQLDEDEFEQCKGVLIDHLQGFRTDLRRHGQEIEEALRLVEALGPERLVAAIVESEELPALPGFTSEQLAAQRHAELLEQWTGVRTWFLGIDGDGSPWAALASKVVEAIRAVLDVAERLIDRRVNRASRAKACEHLARLVHDAPAEADALALVSLAFGWVAPRHVGAPEHDPDGLAAPGRTSWLEAPPAPVTAHLRRPGARAPG
ncbi:MAG: TIGR02677 family protein, partial [Thermoleophilaceae bacterium]